MSGEQDEQAAAWGRVFSQQVGSGGVAAGMGAVAGAMAVELETLKGFRSKIDDLIRELSNSEADPTKIDEERIPAHAFGTGFGEATALHHAYHQVHEQLATLSRLLSGQIQALSTAVDGASHGYHNVDLEAQRHMWQVQQDLQRHYQPGHGHEGGHDDGGHGGDHGDKGTST